MRWQGAPKHVRVVLPYVRKHMAGDVAAAAAVAVLTVANAFIIAAAGIAAGGDSETWALSDVEGKISSHSCGAAQHSLV